MKTVLILAYDFPPYVSVGGLRPYSWYQFLNEYGVFPVVITRQWSNKHGNHLDYVEKSESKKTLIEESKFGMIIRTPYKPNLANRLLLKYGENKFRFFRRLISAWFELAQWIWAVGPKAGLFREAKIYLENNKVDAIIATGDPFVLFKYASSLSRKFQIPWIADYRDPWTNGAGHKEKILLATLLSFDEKKIVKTAKKVTTVSAFFTYLISKVVKEGDFIVLPNGYNPESLTKASKIKQNNKVLSIGFAGTISKYHPILGFIMLMDEFISEFNDIKIHVNFYGTNLNEQIMEIIHESYPRLQSCFSIHPRLSNEMVMAELAQNNVLLLFNNFSFIGTKIYDYIALRRKILFCYDDDPEANAIRKLHFEYNEVLPSNIDPQKELILETNSGIIVKDKDHLKVVLKELWIEFKKNGSIECHSSDIEKYSRKIQAKRLAELIKEIT